MRNIQTLAFWQLFLTEAKAISTGNTPVSRSLQHQFSVTYPEIIYGVDSFGSAEPSLLMWVEFSCECQVGQNLATILNLLRTKPVKTCSGSQKASKLRNKNNYFTNNPMSEWGCVCPCFKEEMPGHLSNKFSLTVTCVYTGKHTDAWHHIWRTQGPREWWHALSVGITAGTFPGLGLVHLHTLSEACSLPSVSKPWFGD